MAAHFLAANCRSALAAALAICLIFFLGAPASCQAERVTIGSLQHDYSLFWAVNCYHAQANTQTSEVWTVWNPSSSDKKQPDSKYYVSTQKTATWEGNPIHVKDLGRKKDQSAVFNLNKLAHSQDDGTMVGTLDFNSGFRAPCYSFGNDKVDFFNGWVCYRLYACSTVEHVVTDVALSSDLVGLEMFAFEDLIRGAGFQGLVSANYQGSVGDQQGNSYVFEVAVQGNPQLDWAIKAITANAGKIGQGIVNQYNPNMIGGQLDLPKAVTIVTFVGLHHDKAVKYDIYFTGVARMKAPDGSCAAAANVASGIAGVLSGVLGAASVMATPATGGASLALGSAAFGAAGGGAALAGAYTC